MRQFSRHRRPTGQNTRGQAIRFWGRHAVLAALANPDRTVKRVWGTREALGQLDLPPVIPISYAEVTDLARLVARDAPHQGLVIEVDPLDSIHLSDLLQEEVDADSKRPLVILDQVTDPHNIGAVLRSAAAFDAAAIITQDRHSPPESGVIARSASGALETVPWVRVVNLSRAHSAMPATPNRASARPAIRRCSAPSSASRSASPPRTRSGTSSRRNSARAAPPK